MEAGSQIGLVDGLSVDASRYRIMNTDTMDFNSLYEWGLHETHQMKDVGARHGAPTQQDGALQKAPQRGRKNVLVDMSKHEMTENGKHVSRTIGFVVNR